MNNSSQCLPLNYNLIIFHLWPRIHCYQCNIVLYSRRQSPAHHHILHWSSLIIRVGQLFQQQSFNIRQLEKCILQEYPLINVFRLEAWLVKILNRNYWLVKKLSLSVQMQNASEQSFDLSYSAYIEATDICCYVWCYHNSIIDVMRWKLPNYSLL